MNIFKTESAKPVETRPSNMDMAFESLKTEKLESVPENKFEKDLESQEKLEIEKILEGGHETEMKVEQVIAENENLAKSFWEKLSDPKHLEHKFHEHSPKIMAALHLGLELATHNPQVAHALVERIEGIEEQFGHIIFEKVSQGVAGTAQKLGQAWKNYRQVKTNKVGLQNVEASI